ncbi:phosphoglycerate kinase [Candidatus Poribacteria bacterium]|nr:phosphoglycerate kinase [Candidatus Poribacteria bacterium]
MEKKLSVRDLSVEGKHVFVRVDVNVPIAEGVITDETRIVASLPTIRLLIERRARVILASHLGRPDGERNPKFSLRPVAERLAARLEHPVAFVDDCIGPAVRTSVTALGPGEVLMLENLRFHPEEEENDPSFAAELAALADLYVNDAFGAAHRAHASTAGVPAILTPAASGLLMDRELEYLGAALENPERPFLVLLGGAKVSDKIGVLRRLVEIADGILIGGAMAYTFLAAMGRRVGNSRVEKDYVETATDVLIRSLQRHMPIYLPIDHVIAKEYGPNPVFKSAYRDTIDDDWEALDIGPNTASMYLEILRRAKTVLWNGPFGVYEFDRFAVGTVAIARALAELDATTVVGGGDCVAAVHKAGVADKITHISTGGGASLEFLEGKPLPGVVALTNADR